MGLFNGKKAKEIERFAKKEKISFIRFDLRGHGKSDGNFKDLVISDWKQDVLDIIDTIDWDVRIIGEEYRNKDFTGRDQTLDKCYFNTRPHNFSSSELRQRVSNEHFKKK